jgi:hypothetical protein
VWRWALIALELLIAANGYYGGLGLIRGGMGMPEEWLVGTPFDSWVLPGIALLLVIAVPMTVAAAAEITRARWAYPMSVAVGVVQILWIVAQVVILRQYFFLQPTLFVLGGLIVLLAWLAHRPHRAA